MTFAVEVRSSLLQGAQDLPKEARKTLDRIMPSHLSSSVKAIVSWHFCGENKASWIEWIHGEGDVLGHVVRVV